MNEYDQYTAPIVFLHIPKTAGQTIHNALAGIVGRNAVSPVRVHTQAPEGAAQLPPGYALYSGHIDWYALDTLPMGRFVFTVLRDPKERIASFYLYLRQKAERTPPAERNLGQERIIRWSADRYFFGGDDAWKMFIRDHYDNFYCQYLATKQVRGHTAPLKQEGEQLLARAHAAIKQLNGVYWMHDLQQLEHDIEVHTRKKIRLVGQFTNTGPGSRPWMRKDSRWSRLSTLCEHASSVRRLEAFTRWDDKLVDQLGFPQGKPAP